GSYIAYVKPVWEESGFVPHEGFIACMNRHWTYSQSMVLSDMYYYAYPRGYNLFGTDALGSLHYYADVMIAGSGADEWTFVAATWELVADGGSSTGYRMDAKVSVRRAGDPSFTSSGIVSTMNVAPDNSPDVFNIGSDAWGNRGYGGWVDWVQIYGKALSDAEIESLYNETVETAPIP
ncbi:MAG: hypothetical protein ABIG61_02530, partial [Planctomycetota bacterium]